MKTLTCLLAATAAIAPISAFALGIRAPDQDAFATARGEAFAATADNPSAIYYNPAGISQLDGQNVRVGFYGIALNSDYSSGFGKASTKDRFDVLPQLFWTYSSKDSDLSFGVGVYEPFGLALEWPDTAPFRSQATYGSLSYITVNPVIAYKPCDHFSLAIGPTINIADLELRRGVAAPGDRFGFDGDGKGVGFNAGLLWKITDQHRVGITYRSQTTINFQGSSQLLMYPPFSGPKPFNLTGPASAKIQFPQSVVLGYSFRPTTNWNFEFNADWTDWSSVRTVGLTTLIPPTKQALAFNWQPSWFYEFGATHYFNNGYRLSGGYIYSENSVPSASFNPVVPDSDRHIFSLGVGRTYASGWNWDITYQFSYGPSRTISNPATAANAVANGSYAFTAHAVSVAIGKSFR